MRGMLGVLVMGAMILALVAGCGPVRRSEPVAGPMDFTDDSVVHGRTVFMAQCHHCHPTGEIGLGPGLNDKPLPAFVIRTQVRYGFGAMPSFSADEISDDDLDAIVRYLRALRQRS